MLTALSSINLTLIGTSFTGPSFIVIVDVPLNIVTLSLTTGSPTSLKSEIVCVWDAVPSVSSYRMLH